MVNPTKESISKPFIRDVSFREALSYDLVSFFAGILFLFVIACLILAIVSVVWFEAPPPQESPSEIFLGLLLITGVVVTVLRLRVSYITKTLRRGEIVVAEVLRGLHYQFFVQISLKYSVRGKVVQKGLWLPNTKRPRTLIKEEQVFLSAKMERAKRIVVRNLYM